MKARLALLVVAIALAVAGAMHHGRTAASHAVAVDAPPTEIEVSVDPGGWWDWH
jgi:hypothetical protein